MENILDMGRDTRDARDARGSSSSASRGGTGMRDKTSSRRHVI